MGYRGRTGIFEVVRPTETLRQLIRSGGSAASLETAAIAGGLVRLSEAGVDALWRGETTLSEVLRQISDLDEPRTLCQACGSAVGVEFAACPRCGAATGRPCAYCGRFLQASWDYCPFCARAVRPAQ
jgi:hypothetical protein